MSRPRMNPTDRAELTELVNTWMKRKRGLIQKGYKLIFWVGAEKMEPSPTVEVRTIEKPTKVRPVKKSNIKKVIGKSPEIELPNTKERRKLNVHDLGLRKQIVNILNKAGVKTAGGLFDIISRKPEVLTLKKGFGDSALSECRAALEAIGFKFF